MTRRSTTVCIEDGCPELTDGTRCQAHQRERQRNTEQRRQPRKRTYDTERWRRRIRPRVLREEPHCRECGRPAEHVDHIDGDQTNNDRGNLQALCGRCHSHKTATVDQQRDADGRWTRRDDEYTAPRTGTGTSVPLG